MVVSAVLLFAPLDGDCSYVDGNFFVVFIIDTTNPSSIIGGVQVRSELDVRLDDGRLELFWFYELEEAT